MPKLLPVVLAASIAVSLLPLAPAPASAAGSADFLSACLKAGGEKSVCSCKADAASKLLDSRMLGLVVLSMQDPGKFAAMSQKGGLTHKDNLAWTAYIRDSNKACKLNY